MYLLNFVTVLFFSFLYVIAKYELKNELMIFWNFGINAQKD